MAVYAGAVPIEPGTYLLRFAVADSEGRMGSVERKLDAWQMNGPGLNVGDLLVAQAPSERGVRLVPAIEPQVGNGRLAAMMEVYASTPQLLEGLQATLDVLARGKREADHERADADRARLVHGNWIDSGECSARRPCRRDATSRAPRSCRAARRKGISCGRSE